jgi:hypothetical protein
MRADAQRQPYGRWVMTRRWRFIAQVACLGTLILAFPAAASAFCGVPVVLTPSGPSPAALTVPAGLYPFWDNNDQVTHTVVFANGLCSLELAPGAAEGCNFPLLVGLYPYAVDGTIQASVVVNALPPTTVTLTARSHKLSRAAHLLLHGMLNWSMSCGPPIFGPLRVPIVVLARHDRHHPFRRFTTVRSEARTPDGGYAWRLNLHPNGKTIYIAKVTYQPVGEQGQRQAWSRPFRVIVRR